MHFALPSSHSTSRRPFQGLEVVAVVLAALVFLADLATPPALVVGTLLSAPVALAALASSWRFALGLLVFAVVANVGAGFHHWHDLPTSTFDVLNRAVSLGATLLVGGLTWRARLASERAVQVEAEKRRAEQERNLRTLVEFVSGPYGLEAFVARAAEGLAAFTGAQEVEIGRVDRTTMRTPHAIFPAGARHHLNQTLPLDVRVPPSSDGSVWTASQESDLLAFLPGRDGDLLVRVHQPQVNAAQLVEAITTLRPLLERTTLLDDLAAQRAHLAEQGEVVRDLIYAFSHDLRTPLMANALHMEQALKGAFGPLPEEYRRTLHNGLEANDSLLSLADQLLTVARYEGGEAQEEAQEVNLRSIVLGVVDQVQPRAQARRVGFDLRLDSVRVYGSKHDLRRAVQNLVDNAVKFSPSEGTVTIELKLDLDDALIKVTDEGPGVPSSRTGNLFQRFRTGGAGGSTGLGLYLTRRIAEAHGGTVSYRRTAQARTVFTLTVPKGETT
ncbi:HAMP domain-containing sensor histidine kinase [Deinococcus deserti]|uniref:histidine kinase n=1 Tax=Deinococcus deserti (strain DSM 17065 / CIP 109153 / LMG 22923 / VCD115) TaxID=546414 RepID=C1D481_DEIDV|nr:HAMP domain-containing sensor histidine kinase [Deinococcus deserti]ACO47962.1 putative histidine kinase, classic; putative membrane protein [Deinococcus deserti VCD115]